MAAPRIPLPTGSSAGDDIDRAIACSACEACCCRLEVLLMAGDDPPSRFIVADEDGVESMHRLDDGWCAALDRDTMRCTIYERRPLVCREFAMGSRECRSERATWLRIDHVVLHD